MVDTFWLALFVKSGGKYGKIGCFSGQLGLGWGENLLAVTARLSSIGLKRGDKTSLMHHIQTN